MTKTDMTKDIKDLGLRQNHRKFFLFLRSYEFEGCPFPFECYGIEELDAAESDGGSGPGPFSFVFIEEKVLTKFFVIDFVRRFAIIPGEHPDSTDVHFDGPFRHAVELHVFNKSFSNGLIPRIGIFRESFTQVCHLVPPFYKCEKLPYKMTVKNGQGRTEMFSLA
jgi:hypothetical protein